MRYSRSSSLVLAAVAAVAAASFVALPVAAQARRGTPPALDDAAIVGIFDAANSWDIATGALAARKAQRTDVKDFGTMLVGAHTAVRQQGRDLAGKLGVTPTPVAGDFALLVQHERALRTLESLSGAAFDTAFLEHEIAYHQAVIDAVTTTFLPAIRNAEVKAFVQSVAPAFQGHMAAAEALLKKQR